MRPLVFAVVAALGCAGAARAQDDSPPHPPSPPQRVAPPLSQEDAELVKELELLEQLELVKNLELFQPDPDAVAKEPQRQP